MKGILNLLARANLVELSEEEKQAAGIEAIPDAALDAPGEMPPPPPPEPEPVLSPDQCEVAAERPLEEIFAAAGVAPSPYPAEKLLRLLDGLRAMDNATRKAAVLAMDAADDNWQIADCVYDAEQKIAAIDAYKRHLAAQVAGSEQQTAARIGDIKAGLENATAAIRKQISELEQLLEREVTRAAQQTTALEAELRTTRETAARETRRMDGEIERLREITAQFGSAPAAKP